MLCKSLNTGYGSLNKDTEGQASCYGGYLSFVNIKTGPGYAVDDVLSSSMNECECFANEVIFAPAILRLLRCLGKRTVLFLRQVIPMHALPLVLHSSIAGQAEPQARQAAACASADASSVRLFSLEASIASPVT